MNAKNTTNSGETAAGQAGEVFTRKASGLTRVVSPWAAFAYSFIAPNIPLASFYIIWSYALFQGANIPLAVVFMLALVPFAAIYVFFSSAMPRSGGEYVYVSRVLTPLLGFLSSWCLTICGLNWAGMDMAYIVNWGFAHTLIEFGLIYKTQPLINLGMELSKPQGSWLVWIIGSILLVLLFFVIYRGMRLFLRFVWASMIMTWVSLLVFIVVMLSVNPEVVANGMKTLQGINYLDVLKQAQSLGWQPGFFSLPATIMAGMTFISLSALGSTFSANIAGEIKRVDRAQPIAQYLSILGFMIYYWLYSFAANHGIGKDMLQAIGTLNANGQDTQIFQVFPQIPFLLTYATQNPLLLLFGGSFTWALIGFCAAMGLAMAPVRNMFAYSFDGMLPAKWNEVDRRGSPIYAVIVCFIIAWFSFTLYTITPLFSAYLLYTITIWFFGWALMSIAAILFPLRRKDIWEKAPAITRQKILGVPGIVVAGVFGLVISLLIMYFTFVPTIAGTAVILKLPHLLVSFGFYMILPIILYLVAVSINKKRGIPIEKRFTEVPPD
jgi:amino acid transporter